jgi:D-xylose transport system substrate-binding protein
MVVGAALAAMAGSAAPAGGAAAPADVCVLLPSTSLARWESQDRRYLAAAFMSARVSHSILNAAGSGARQLTQARECLANGAKVVLLTSVDARVGRTVGRLAAGAGVPVVDYVRLTPGGSASYLVAPDDVEAGRLMAGGVVGALAAASRTPVVGRLGTPRSEPASPSVARGYDSVLARLIRTHRIAAGPAASVPSWRPPALQAVARRVLGAGGSGVDAVVAADDRLAGAVVSALRAEGRRPIPLSGRSATVEGVRNVVSGWQTGTVYDSPKLQAYAAARVAVDLVNGRPVRTNGRTGDGARRVPSVLLRPVWITRNNYAVLFAEGVHTRSTICGGEYAQFCR